MEVEEHVKDLIHALNGWVNCRPRYELGSAYVRAQAYVGAENSFVEFKITKEDSVSRPIDSNLAELMGSLIRGIGGCEETEHGYKNGSAENGWVKEGSVVRLDQEHQLVVLGHEPVMPKKEAPKTTYGAKRQNNVADRAG